MIKHLKFIFSIFEKSQICFKNHNKQTKIFVSIWKKGCKKTQTVRGKKVVKKRRQGEKNNVQAEELWEEKGEKEKSMREKEKKSEWSNKCACALCTLPFSLVRASFVLSQFLS